MAVVINDFEVIPAPPEPAAAPGTRATGGGQAPSPQEIVRAVRHHAARMARVWAH